MQGLFGGLFIAVAPLPSLKPRPVKGRPATNRFREGPADCFVSFNSPLFLIMRIKVFKILGQHTLVNASVICRPASVHPLQSHFQEDRRW